jgi:hypothetical protein
LIVEIRPIPVTFIEREMNDKSFVVTPSVDTFSPGSCSKPFSDVTVTGPKRLSKHFELVEMGVD